MVSASQKRKSLFDFPGSAGATGFGRMGTYTAASTCARTSAVTGGYNQELNSFLCDMRATQAADAARYGDKLFTPNSAARQRGVELAWRYEKKSILMGGKGSENWTAAERREIVETGSLRGSQGHHQRNVALHPEDQANPHNIKFYRSQREHLQNGHKGSWSNESDAPMINRDKMLTRTNARRVFRNEVRGIGLTAAIGLGIGFSIGFAATLAQSGISVGTIQDALKGGLQGGLTAAGLSVTGYALSRTLGQVASCAVVPCVCVVALFPNQLIVPYLRLGNRSLTQHYHFSGRPLNAIRSGFPVVSRSLSDISSNSVSIPVLTDPW